MEYRQLGRSGLKVPVLSYGTATFGGAGDFFKAWGSTDVAEAKRLVDLCMEQGLNFFDTTNVYSKGTSEEILGQAIQGRRQDILLATKSTFPMGTGPNDYGSSRKNIIEQCEASLKRLKTDYIDIFYMHGMDTNTPIEETLRTLNSLVESGKVRYIGCSNFSAWHLMKSLSISEQKNLNRYVAHQIYYSAIGRDTEWELLPLAADQGVGSVIWSPLAGGALSGKIRRDQPAPKDSRLGQIKFVAYKDDTLYAVVDVLADIAKYREKTIAQVALNWILRKPTVANIVVGARNEDQLKQNFGAIGWKLTDEEVARIDKAGEHDAPYPYWHQAGFPQLVSKLPSVADSRI